MKLRTETNRFGFIGSSVTEAKVEHNRKKTYKGAKLVRTSNIVNELQAGAIDRADNWKRKREERRNKRRAGF